VGFLCKDHGNPTLLANYRPIALCNSFCQLINIIITGKIRGLTEKYAGLEFSQHGFRGSRSVQHVIQQERWLLKQEMKQDTKLIRVDLDFKNTFNSARHSNLWKILEGLGVPDVDTGTGTRLCPFPPPVDLFINALLRLFESTGIFHREVSPIGIIRPLPTIFHSMSAQLKTPTPCSA